MPKNLLESWMADPGAEPLPRPQRSLFGNKRTDAGEWYDGDLVLAKCQTCFIQPIMIT